MRRDLPEGTVTFVFTDIEGSTRLLEELGADAYGELLTRHHEVCRAAWGAHDGAEVDTAGDAFFVVFRSSSAAIAAARDAQVALAELGLRVRMGVHTGEASLGETGYVGFEVHRAARIAAAAHGGQVVVSGAAARGVDGDELLDLGEHRFKDVDEPVAIFQLGRDHFPPLNTLSNTNLPRPASSFVGRESELLEVLARFEDGARLVTLTGPGGSGKTRLAIEAAATLVPDVKAGVFWVGLATLRDPGLVTQTIAQLLGAKGELAAHIDEREMLLLLDNLEQVIDAAPELSALLRACPRLRLLVTSRELLRVDGEVEYSVPPLAETEAVALFCERARIESSAEIGELCARLDNLPLAVELAAARTKVLSPAQITERLAQRLDVLQGGRDADPRQRTLRATIEWSYDLLEEEERRLLRALSVFVGGCTLDAAERVAGADLDTLQSLVEKSLLRLTNGRYWMLETIREFGADRLEASNDAADVRREFAEEMARVVRTAADQASSAASLADRIEPEYANIRTILVPSQEVSRELGLAVAAKLLKFWDFRGLYAEARRWLAGLLEAAPGGLPELEVECLSAAAMFAQRQGDYEDATRALERAHLLASTAGDREALAEIANITGIIAGLTGDLAKANACFESSVADWRALENEDALAIALGNLGRVLLESGKIDAAQPVLEESLELGRRGSSPTTISWALGILGRVAAARGNLVDAQQLLCEALRELETVRFPWLVAEWLEELALIASRSGDRARSGKLWGAAESLRAEIGAPLAPVEAERHESMIRELQVGQSSSADDVAEGRSWTLEAAIEYALASID